jgi:hypothetical protein
LKGTRSHKRGGIPAIVTDADKEVFVESGEIVITKGAVADNTERTLHGTNVEILSQINELGGGVPIMRQGGTIGDDLWIEHAIKHKGILKRKAKEMGLIENVGDTLTEADLDKLSELGDVWKKRVQLARELNNINNQNHKTMKTTMESGGKINPRLAELKKEIATWKERKEAGEKHNATVLVDNAKKKIDKLQSEYDKLEASEAGKSALHDIKEEKVSMMPKTRVKKVEKPKVKKTRKKTSWSAFLKEHAAEYKIKYGMKLMAKELSKDFKAGKTTDKTESGNRKIGTQHELMTLKDGVWMLKNIETGKEDIEINKTKEGKFVVTCIKEDRPEFDTLDEALDYVRKTLLKGELGKIVEQKKEKAKNQKAWLEKHPKGETTPLQDMKKVEEKVIEKIKEKADNGENVDKQVEAIMSVLKKLLEKLSKITGEKFTITKN